MQERKKKKDDDDDGDINRLALSEVIATTFSVAINLIIATVPCQARAIAL